MRSRASSTAMPSTYLVSIEQIPYRTPERTARSARFASYLRDESVDASQRRRQSPHCRIFHPPGHDWQMRKPENTCGFTGAHVRWRLELRNVRCMAGPLLLGGLHPVRLNKIVAPRKWTRIHDNGPTGHPRTSLPLANAAESDSTLWNIGAFSRITRDLC